MKNNVKAACIVDTNGSRLHVDGFYDSTKEILSFMKQTTLIFRLRSVDNYL